VTSPAAASVAVVVPARDAADTVGDAVRSAAQDPVDEILVAVPPDDHATADAVRRAAADLPTPIHVVANPAGTTPAALNAAIAASAAEVIVRVDAHSTLPPGYVAHAVATLRATGAANVGGVQRGEGRTWFERAVALAMASPVASGGAAYRGAAEPQPADTVYLGVFDRAALDAVGGFDERMVRNQDAELNVRLRAAGHEVWFDPALEVAYRPRGSVASLARQYHGYGRWRRVTGRLHPGSLRLRQLAAPVLVLGLVAGAVVGLVWWWWLLLVLVAAWLLVLVAAGLRAGPAHAAGVVLAIAVMHLAWGVGFLTSRPRRLLAAATSRQPEVPA
jgi:succinoglycan biosynthesis protein ExoA